MTTPRNDGCYACGKLGDLRPYGPHGAMTCFACAMSTPELKRTAEQMFGAQLTACGEVAVIDGSGSGPYPAAHHPQLSTWMGGRRGDN